MIYWSVDCKEPVNLHADDVKAPIDKGKNTNKVVKGVISKFASFVQFHLKNDSNNAIGKSDADSNEIVDLQDMVWFNPFSVTFVSDDRKDDIHYNSQSHNPTGISPEKGDLVKVHIEGKNGRTTK